MYVFRIADVIDRSKSWYRGEEFALYGGLTTLGNPPGYQSAGTNIGETREASGYLYTSLQDNNLSQPEYNYVGFPLEPTTWSGNNSWIRSDYANSTKMFVADSGGITESYNKNIEGFLTIPESSGIIAGVYYAPETCSCFLLHGILGKKATINGMSLSNLDYNGISIEGYGDPEVSELAAAVTLSSTTATGCAFSIEKSSKGRSSYCAGAYIGTWSYIGKTQWTDHKKEMNDYSKQEQDTWGNYSLSKRRVGRTYSAEVILTPRRSAVPGDYDYSIESLCFSVLQILRSLLGKAAAFYFNNQDIGCPWIPHNIANDDGIVRLNNADIIVGVLQRFNITNIQGDRAILNLSVTSVPNEYKKYGDTSANTPASAPVLNGDHIPMCTSVSIINADTDDTIAAGSVVNVSLNTQYWKDFIRIIPTPEDAPIIDMYSDSFGYTTVSAVLEEDDDGNDILVVTSTGKTDPAFESRIVAGSGEELIIQLKGLLAGGGEKKNFFKIQLGVWDTEQNTYGLGALFWVSIISTIAV